MKLTGVATLLTALKAQNSFLDNENSEQQEYSGPMDPMMMMLMMKDSSSSMKDLLPLMMMSGGMNDPNSIGGIDPMMMLMLSDDSSSLGDLLPLMMMNGGLGAVDDLANGGMNPLLMMSLMEDSCEITTGAKDLDGTDEEKEDVARGSKVVSAGSIIDAGDLGDGAYIDYDFIKCETNSGSGLSDLLPLMLMGNSNNMDPMMMMLMLGDDSSSLKDLLPLMMMGGGSGPHSLNINPMMMMLMMGDKDTKTKSGCDTEYKMTHAFTMAKSKIESASEIRTAVEGDDILGADKSTWETDYKACLDGASTEIGSSSNSKSIKDLLPFMMMNGGLNGAGGMDPMMMMILISGDDSASVKDLLPFMMMNGGMMSGPTARAVDSRILRDRLSRLGYGSAPPGNSRYGSAPPSNYRYGSTPPDNYRYGPGPAITN